MSTPDEHLARISGGKDIKIAMLCAELDNLREENEKLRLEVDDLTGPQKQTRHVGESGRED
jgi:hypothetical protein